MKAPFIVSPELTAIAVMYAQANLIADAVLPRVPVSTEQFEYVVYPAAQGFSVPQTLVGRRSAPNQVDFSGQAVTASTSDYGLDAPVPNKDIVAWRNASAAGLTRQASPEAIATSFVTSLVLTQREKRASDLVFNAASYGAANKETLAGTSQWSDYANSNPQNDILQALDAMVMRGNKIVFGRAAWTAVSQHPKICKAIFGMQTDAGIVSRQAFANLFELDEVLVGEGWLNTAAPGQPAAMSRIWGKHAALINCNSQASPMGGLSFGYTAQFGDRIAGTIEDSDIGLSGGVRVRSGERVKELITANDLGYFFQNAVA